MHLKRSLCLPDLRMVIVFVAAGFTFVNLFALVSVQAQNRPVREPLPATDITSQYCPDFPVLIHPLVNREFATIYSDGRVHISGTVILQLTNIITQKSIVVNASGPATFTADGTTIVAEGRGLLFGEAGFFGPGSPAAELSMNEGRTVISTVDNTLLSRAREQPKSLPGAPPVTTPAQRADATYMGHFSLSVALRPKITRFNRRQR
jgi:hypothetical protein